jgi:hypothetical protein
LALSFNIVQWHAWAPGIADAESWSTWAQAPYIPHDLALQPDVSFVPAMQRRRLTRLARMCFAAAWPLAPGAHPIPLVFGSSHGETPLTFQLLDALAHAQPLSPTQFGLSVHNAVGGQWSIQRGDKAEVCAVAAQQDSLEHAFVEACGLMHEHHGDVLVMLAEDSPAALYRGGIDDVPFPYAAAFRIGPGSDWTLATAPHEEKEARRDTSSSAASWGHALDMLRALLVGERTITHACPPRCWTWQKQC